MSEHETTAPTEEPRPKRKRPVLNFLKHVLEGWRLRHQLPINFALHLIGIPMAVAGVVMLFFLEWYWGASFFVVGYLLQYVGHCLEGNTMGEWAAVKRQFGLPYVGIAPRWNPEDPNRL